jgi:hypothetical protein
VRVLRSRAGFRVTGIGTAIGGTPGTPDVSAAAGAPGAFGGGGVPATALPWRRTPGKLTHHIGSANGKPTSGGSPVVEENVTPQICRHKYTLQFFLSGREDSSTSLGKYGNGYDYWIHN